jgi:hypothetical protein
LTFYIRRGRTRDTVSTTAPPFRDTPQCLRSKDHVGAGRNGRRWRSVGGRRHCGRVRVQVGAYVFRFMSHLRACEHAPGAVRVRRRFACRPSCRRSCSCCRNVREPAGSSISTLQRALPLRTLLRAVSVRGSQCRSHVVLSHVGRVVSILQTFLVRLRDKVKDPFIPGHGCLRLSVRAVCAAVFRVHVRVCAADARLTHLCTRRALFSLGPARAGFCTRASVRWCLAWRAHALLRGRPSSRLARCAHRGPVCSRCSTRRAHLLE